MLGPLEVIGPVGPVAITGNQERVVLTVLAAWSGHAVSNERLADALWGDRPPRSRVQVVHNLVSQLRKTLGSDAIETRPGGYVLRVAPDAIDVQRFDRLVGEGRRRAADEKWVEAAEAFSTAVALWRGKPFGWLADWPPVSAEAARLEEQYRCALEEQAGAELTSGRHAEVVAPLEAMVREEPLRERRWALLMSALYRCGRQADALRAFQRARCALGELGLEPGRELAQLERDISLHIDVAPAAVGEAEAFAVPCPAVISVAPAFAFAGREVERQELEVAWAKAKDGERRTVLIGGESGAGKTRLAFELARRLAADGAAVLLGTCDTELAMPYQPWVHVLEHLVRAMPAEVATSLSDELADVSLLVTQLERTVPGLGRASAADRATEQYRLFSAVDAILADTARRWPTIVVVDDLQWASPQSLALLHHLSRPSAASRLLLIGTFRDTGDEITEPLASFLADLRRTETSSRLRLTGLDQAAVEQFVAGAVGHELDGDLRVLASSLAEHSGGNPFYVSELWRHIVASKVVEQQGGRWAVRRSAEVGVPDGVREVVAHRVRKLSGPARRVLELAAVAGQQVDLRVLEEAGDVAGGTVGGGMDELVEAKLLLEIGGVLPIYLFAHAIVRDTVAGAIPPSVRARLHQRVAEAIESVFEADLRPVYAQLAGHFASAVAVGASTKAVHYSRRAAGQAMDLVAYDEAVKHLSVALELSTVPAERVDILLDLGRANAWHGLPREATAALTDAFRLARELRLVPQAMRAAAEFGEAVQIHGLPGGPAVEIVSEALALVGDGDGPSRTRLQSCLAEALALAGRPQEAQRMSELAIAAARCHGDPRVLLAALWSGFDFPNDSPRWLRISQEAAEVADQLDDPWASARAKSAVIRGLFISGRIEDARVAVVEFRHTVERRRFVLYRYMAMNFDVMLSVIDGRFADAERFAEAAHDFGSSSRSESDAGVYGVQMYFIRREQGRLAEVAPVLQLAAALEPDAPVWRPGLAALFADTGKLDDARREFDRLSLDGFAPVPRDAMWPCCLSSLAEVCIALGDQTHAGVLYGELEGFRGYNLMVGFTICLGPAERLMGSLAALTGRDDAEAHFVAALELAERSGSPVWRAHVQHDWAVALGDRPDLLAAAGATARQIGMDALAERCRLALGEPAVPHLAGGAARG